MNFKLVNRTTTNRVEYEFIKDGKLVVILKGWIKTVEKKNPFANGRSNVLKKKMKSPKKH